MRFARLLPYLGCSFAVGSFYGFSNFSLPLWLAGYISSLVIISTTHLNLASSLVSRSAFSPPTLNMPGMTTTTTTRYPWPFLRSGQPSQRSEGSRPRS